MPKKTKPVTAADAIAAFPLTPEEERLIRATANTVWQNIATDCLDANDGRPMDRASVIEVVMDADRLTVALRRGAVAAASMGVLALVTALTDWKSPNWPLADRRLTDLCATAFPYAQYV